jgi:ribonuclease BN (tRNA processing enzyme)
MYGPGRELPPPPLWVPPGGRAYLAGLTGGLGGGPDMFERAFEIHEYAVGSAQDVAGFELTPLPVPHYGMATHGFRVAADGVTVAYSADTGPGEEVVDLARDADLFLCEATLAVWEPEPRGHLALAEAESVFAASGAGRLLVTHRPHELPVGDGVELARDGLVLEL